MQKYGCAKFRKSAPVRDVCNVCAGVAAGGFFAKKLKMCADVQDVCDVRADVAGRVCLQKNCRNCAKVWMCEFPYVCTRARCVQHACRCGCQSLFAKKL